MVSWSPGALLQQNNLLLLPSSTQPWVSAGVAFLESKFNLDLQHAMLLVPTAYALSGIAFYGAEAVMKKEKALNGSTML